MTSDGWLWDRNWKPVTAPHSDDDTSKEAAVSMRRDVLALRALVFDRIAQSGDKGMTDEEIARALGLEGNTARPRRWELANMGRIEKSGEKRKTSRGRRAVVWVVKR